MKSRTGAGLGFIVLALCLVLLLVLVQGVANTPFRSAARPIASPIQPTALPTVDIVATGQSAAATLAAQATATTAAFLTAVPTVVPTFTALPSGQRCYVDHVNGFSLLLNPGWHAQPPLAGAASGDTILYNYDPEAVMGAGGGGGSEATFPPGGIKIQISAQNLAGGQSLQQWVSDLISFYTSPDAPTPITSTTPIPYTLGRYESLSFTFTEHNSSSLKIVLPMSNELVLIIGLWPADSSAISDGLALLATLDISGAGTCAEIPVATQ